MYKVLLVDDEQMALTGMKFMIDWERAKCEIIDTATNGKEALEKIGLLLPDIVICDISLPVCSGITVLEQTAEWHPKIVFIMLTNYQEFDLAQQSLRYKAVDYLLKTNLQPEEILAALEKAGEEVQRRRQLGRVEFVEDYLINNQKQILTENLRLIFSEEHHPGIENAWDICEEQQLFQQYFIIRIVLRLSELQYFARFTKQERANLFLALMDIIQRMADHFFEKSIIIKSDVSHFYLFVAGEAGVDEAKVQRFQTRLAAHTQNIMNVGIALLVSGMLEGRAGIEAGREQIMYLENRYLREPAEVLLFKEQEMDYESARFNVNVILEELTPAIRRNDEVAVDTIFRNLIELFAASSQKKHNAISCCIQIYTYIENLLAADQGSRAYQRYFHDADAQLTIIACANEFSEILQWLEQLRSRLIGYIRSTFNPETQDYLTLAAEYIRLHVDEKITLKDVAAYVSITPNYLSSMFKQKYHQNFVDYVNMIKMQEACRLIAQRKYLMYEIAYKLGYENAYYFSKIFKKYIGQTPKEYQVACMKGSEEDDTKD